MEEEKKKAYSEVVEILKLIDNEEKLEKIPFEVIELIKNNSDPQYRPNIDKNKPLEEQKFMDETFSIMAWIASKYWNEDIGLENNITQEAKNYENCIKQENIIQETITSENKIESATEQTEKLNAEAAIYNDMEPQLQERCEEIDNLPMLIPETKWYIRIKEKVIKLLKILFRVRNVREESN